MGGDSLFERHGASGTIQAACRDTTPHGVIFAPTLSVGAEAPGGAGDESSSALWSASDVARRIPPCRAHLVVLY